MEHLDEISTDDLRRALDEVEGKKAAKRLIAAIAYKNGVTQTELAEWYGVQRRTIYSWLTRLEREPIEEAVYDDQRSGRPRKLTDAQQERLKDTLHETPARVGYDASSWTPALVEQYLVETFDVEYSIPSCRRLMKETGLRYQAAHRSGTEVDTGDRKTSNDEHTEREGRWIPK